MMWVVVWGAVARPQLPGPGPRRWGAGSIPWGCRPPHTTEASLWLVIIRLPYHKARSFTSAQSRPQALAGVRPACEARWGLRVHLEAGEETAQCLRSMGALVTREQPVSCWTVRSCETEAGTTWPPGNKKGLGAWDWVGWCWVERRSGGKEEVKVLTKAGLSCCHLFWCNNQRSTLHMVASSDISLQM